jgi:hypothetical protein
MWHALAAEEQNLQYSDEKLGCEDSVPERSSTRIANIETRPFATPAFAEDFHVAVDLTSGRCVMMNTKHKMMGKNASKDERAGQRAA